MNHHDRMILTQYAEEMLHLGRWGAFGGVASPVVVGWLEKALGSALGQRRSPSVLECHRILDVMQEFASVPDDVLLGYSEHICILGKLTGERLTGGYFVVVETNQIVSDVGRDCCARCGGNIIGERVVAVSGMNHSVHAHVDCLQR